MMTSYRGRLPDRVTASCDQHNPTLFVVKHVQRYENGPSVRTIIGRIEAFPSGWLAVEPNDEDEEGMPGSVNFSPGVYPTAYEAAAQLLENWEATQDEIRNDAQRAESE